MLDIQNEIPLAPYTTFKIGGPARYFIEVKKPEELVEVINWAKCKQIKYFILGGGSNLLFSDRGYDGLIIKISDTRIGINDIEINCGAGALLSQVVNVANKAGLSGLEWAIGLPGTIGGAICGNAGAHDNSIADSVSTVEIYDGSAMRSIASKNLEFKYRSSIFEHHKDYIIMSAKLKLKKTDKKQIKNLIEKNLSERQKLQPIGFSAGSIFENPSDNYAAKMIDECGLKGLKVGGAQISEQHANFIINLGNATAGDVLALIKKIKGEVYRKYGICLAEEICLVE